MTALIAKTEILGTMNPFVIRLTWECGHKYSVSVIDDRENTIFYNDYAGIEPAYKAFNRQITIHFNLRHNQEKKFS